MGWILLIVIVLAGTAIWPLGRWALKDDAEPGVVGFWASLTVAVVCVVGTALTGDWRGAPAGVWLAGGAMSVAYAVGFWICIMRVNYCQLTDFMVLSSTGRCQVTDFA